MPDLKKSELLAEVFDVPEEEARVVLKRLGYQMRVANRDGDYVALIANLATNRVNVRVDDGMVTSILSIG